MGAMVDVGESHTMVEQKVVLYELMYQYCAPPVIVPVERA